MSNTKDITQVRNGMSVRKFLAAELRPKGKTFTWFNMISVPIMTLGVVLIVIRFAKGIGSITNLDQDIPWGLWIGFDVVTGVAFAGGAYVLTFKRLNVRAGVARPNWRVVSRASRHVLPVLRDR